MVQDTDTNGSKVDNVTREQGGQFIDEGGHMFTPDLEERVLAGDTDAQLHDDDKSSVHALQVNMERSGADYVQAQRSFMTNSGAREIHADSAKLTQSGVLTLHADAVEMKQSSTVIANAKEINAHESRLGIATAEKMQLQDSSSIGLLTSGEVSAQGDMKAFMMVAGNVHAGGTITTTLDRTTAGIAAAVFALALVLFGKLLGRK